MSTPAAQRAADRIEDECLSYYDDAQLNIGQSASIIDEEMIPLRDAACKLKQLLQAASDGDYADKRGSNPEWDRALIAAEREGL